jgi:hypothetical protein
LQEVDITLLPQLKPLFEDEARHQVIVAHRRFGKTSYGVYRCLLAALSKKDSRYFIILPTYTQGKMVAWKMLRRYSEPLKDFITKVNESTLTVEFVNGASIEIKGSDNPDSL